MESLAPPKRLGRYVVGTKIGGGGMASIFLGRAAKSGDEELVALKVIRDEYLHDEHFSSMFVDEAKILAQLSHPNVIRTLEYGIEGHHRFIAMELLSGRTLADVWEQLVERNEALSVRLAAWICARVADGLHCAHELVDDTGAPLSVVHRDVNPANIFLTHTGEVKLIDFGLAKARHRKSISVDGIVKGKIPYLSPEQAHGIAIDRRTDVYALGTTLWEAVTMRRLFKRSTDVATLHAIRAAVVPDVRSIAADVPERLWTIIEKATRRELETRYATTEALRDDLDAFLEDTSAMPKELSELLARLFPGQEALHADWLKDATMRPSFNTIPPPAPLPTASSRLLEIPPSAPSVTTMNVDDEPERSKTGKRRSRAKQPVARRAVTTSTIDHDAVVKAREERARRTWIIGLCVSVILAVITVLCATR